MEKTHRQIMSERAKRLRKEMTRQERKLWYQFLCSYEFPFVTQKVMGNYILDFYCRRLHLSIELDGSQHYEPRGLAYDRVRTTYLESQGIKELRFSNREVDQEFEGVCEVIHREAQSRRPDVMQFQLDFSKLINRS